MNLADVFTVLFVILGLMVIFVAYWLMVGGLFPRRTERCAVELGAGPLKAGVVGLVGFIPLVAIGIAISKAMQNPAGKLLGVILIFVAIFIALAGAAGLALRIGQGLPCARDNQEPWRRMLRGGIVLALTLGSFVVLPVVLFLGFGAFVLAGLRRPQPVPAAGPVLE